MSLFGLVGSGHKTLRAKKNTPVGSKGLQLKRHIEATLGQGGDILAAVRLPPGEDLREWLAVNMVDFYNAASVLYSTLAEFCTPAACEVMSAGGKFEYLWADGVRVKRPQRLSAPDYVGRLFDWVEAQIDDPAVFPAQFGAPFPPNFADVARTIARRLFRVYAHIYHSHFKQVGVGGLFGG
jgi:MOB kinase activator 1